MADALLEVENLTVSFPSDEGIVKAVRGMTFSLQPGRVLGIAGESGSGKSVTSLAIMGLLPGNAKVAGSVRFRGKEILGASERELSHIRGSQISVIFQDPMSSLNPVYTVGWQVAEMISEHQDVSKADAWKRAVELLETVGIPRAAERAKAYPHEFSGGMQQRVVIAIAMANDPDVIIADEPTTALDVTVQAQVLEALKTAQQKTNAAVDLHHARPRRHGRDRRRDHGHVRRASRSSTAPTDEIFYARACRTRSGCSRRCRVSTRTHRAVAADPGLAAVRHQPAVRVPVPSALPARADRCAGEEPSCGLSSAGSTRRVPLRRRARGARRRRSSRRRRDDTEVVAG